MHCSPPAGAAGQSPSLRRSAVQRAPQHGSPQKAGPARACRWLPASGNQGWDPAAPGRHCQPLAQTAPGKPPGQGSTHHRIAYWTADFTSFLAAGPRGKPWLSNGGGERTGPPDVGAGSRKRRGHGAEKGAHCSPPLGSEAQATDFDPNKQP